MFPSYGPSYDYWMSQIDIVRYVVHLATHQLQACYGDHSILPETCEEQYAISLFFVSNLVPPVGQSDLFQNFSVIQQFIGVAQFERSYSPLTWFSLSGSYGPLEVNVPLLSGAVLSGYNVMMNEARQQKACKFWMSAWDGYGCSN